MHGSLWIPALLLTLIPLTSLVASPPPDTLWTQVWGQPEHDKVWAVVGTRDSGSILAGSTRAANGVAEAMLMRTDAAGQLLWVRTYGDYDAMEATAIVETRDGGFLFVGYTHDLGGYAARVNRRGDLRWAQTYWRAEPYQPLPGFLDVCLREDESFVAKLERGVGLLCCDAAGGMLWLRQHGDPLLQGSGGLAVTPDGGIMVLGMGGSCGQNYPMLVKFSATGDVLFERNYWLPQLDTIPQQSPKDMAILPDGGFIFVGHALWAYHVTADIFLVRTDANGDTLWTRTYGDPDNDELAYSVAPTIDGGFVVCGATGGLGFTLFKFDADGDIAWMRLDCPTNISSAHSVHATSDHGIISAGYFIPTARLDRDIFVVRLEPERTVTLAAESPAATCEFALAAASPNPFNSSTVLRFRLEHDTHVRLTIFDLAGRQVATLLDARRGAGEHRVTWHPDGLPSGVYLCRFEVEGFSQTQKVVLLK